MYTEKVMKHFRNPRNMGSIKDADAVGTAGNPVCLPPNEKILLNNTFENIIKSKNCDVVLSHDAKYNKITGKFWRQYKNKLVILKNALGKISVTPEHLIYALKLPEHYNFLRNKNKKKLSPAWYHAEHLKKGDIILYPICSYVKDIEFLEITVPKLKHDFKSHFIPAKIPLNEQLLRLFGYFITEGNIQEKFCKTYISFTFNINEKDLIEDVKNLCKDLFNLNVKIGERPGRKTTVVFLYSTILARFFKQLFGNGAQNKKLPDFIMTLPLEKQRALILGLWRGDGYVNLHRNGPRAGYATISYQLAQQIKILLLRQGIAFSLYEDEERFSKWAHHKKAYRIHVGQRGSLLRLCSILGINYIPTSYQSIDSWFDGQFFYTPLTKAECINYEGEVYNLEVENAHSFVSEAFCLHNCGDIMKIYLKISSNKIKEIKFETLGCPAAIATTSVLTTLAKGKTLGEARKISWKEIADSLGGLPPVKMHCSNLATEALKAAIANYSKKH